MRGQRMIISMAAFLAVAGEAHAALPQGLTGTLGVETSAPAALGLAGAILGVTPGGETAPASAAIRATLNDVPALVGSLAGETGVSTGNGAIAATAAVAIGDGAHASGSVSAAIGGNALASGDASLAVGVSADATGLGALALGPNATASGDAAVAIGGTALASAAGSVAIGSGSVAEVAGTVSVGAPGLLRRIVNAADGVNAHDLATVGQVNAVFAALPVVPDLTLQVNALNANVSLLTTTSNNHEIRITTVETKNTEQDTRITATETKNVEQDGRLSAHDTRIAATEAKNVQQDGRLDAHDAELAVHASLLVDHESRIGTLETNTGLLTNRVGALEDSFASLSNDINGLTANMTRLENQMGRGFAMAASLATITPSSAGRTTFRVGYGNYSGNNAIGLTAAHRFTGETPILADVGFSASEGDTMMRAGVGVEF